MARNTVIDIYRCLLMLGICMLHAVAQAGHNVPWVANLLSWCVTGFAFISGWFGIKFSVGKLIKLYGISAYCAAVYVGLDEIIQGGGVEVGACILRIIKITKGQWFLNAYAVLMCLAPMVNAAVDMKTSQKILGPLLLCAFGWSFATTLPIIGEWVPKANGLTAYSFLTLLGAYATARVLHEHGLPAKAAKTLENKWVLAGAILLCAVMCAIGFNDYNSPFALLMAALTFLAFQRWQAPSWLGTVGVWLAPSMFSVYLIHSHGYAWGYLKASEDWLMGYGLPIWGAWILMALAIFVLGVGLDMPRRMGAKLWKGKR